MNTTNNTTIQANKEALILLSGGLDSTVLLAYAIKQGYECTAVYLDYNQAHKSELNTAKQLIQSYNLKHYFFKIDSNLSDFNILNTANKQTNYTPGRNAIFLACISAVAEKTAIERIFFGIQDPNLNIYPDCKLDFFKHFEKMIVAGSKVLKNFQVLMPFYDYSKAKIIKIGTELGVDFSKTVTCYRANLQGLACGTCDSCIIRKEGFKQANIKDQTKYIAS